MWWALIEEIAPRVKEVACEKEMTCEKEMACCVSGYHVYKDIWAAAIGEVHACSREPTNAEIFRCKNYIRVKYFRPFSSYENIFTTKYKRITVYIKFT